MNTAWLFVFMFLGGLLALVLIRHGSSLLDRLPLKKKPLKCLVPYVRKSARPEADGGPWTNF
jgi:hypothetical protein